MKKYSPWEVSTLKELTKDCVLWEKHHTGAGEERKEEGAAEATCDELTASPIPCPALLMCKELDMEVKLNLGSSEG